ncbi:MAG TPA: FAD-dependent oxidoreductase [Pseudolysinimonas sp.]|jgi:glycine/D-amino acid oxidase-like deaminating enzyme|nr:FAD-dependent oxidoreductase [Pseudolysinimonas sp.]
MRPTAFERHVPAPSVIAESLRDTRDAVFWTEDAPGERFPKLRGTVEADLAVVGGGYTGLWTALRAKERDPDARVVVVEARSVGWAASGRNGGFVEASLTHGEENGRRRWPEELEQLDRLGMQNLDEIEATVRDSDFERTGTLSVAIEPHQLEWLEGESTPDSVFLDGEAVRRELDSPTYLAGRWDRRTTALVHPAKLANELARLARDRGVEIFEDSPVRAVAGTTVQTAAGQVHARQVALATNVFPSLLKRNRLMTVPVYDYVLMTEPLSPAQLASIGWSNRQGLADLANQFHYYRLTADNRILFGGYDAVYHYGGRVRERYENRPASHQRLASHFFTTFPQLEGLRFSHRWAGAIDTCTRFCAFYGTARGGQVAYAAGFTGLGVAATRFAADVMLDLLAGESTERTELRMVRERPLPFPPEPAAAVGINLTRWSLDRADHREGRRNLLLTTLDALGLGFDS